VIPRTPAYTRRKPLADGKWGYYFEPPSWARAPTGDDDRGPCPVGSEELGSDYDTAVQRVERVLLPLFHSWRTRGAIDMRPAGPLHGTLDWLFSAYRRTGKFSDLDHRTRSLHEAGFKLVDNFLLRDGRRLGAVKIAAIDSGVVDRVYEKLLPFRDQDGNPIPLLDDRGKPLCDPSGQPLFRERRTTVNHAMKSCRRAWNVAQRLHKTIVPSVNPFEKMGLKAAGGSVAEATYEELAAAEIEAEAQGLFSLAAAFRLTWEWLQREEHIFTAFRLDHYRPKDHPDEVLVVHPKSGDEVWIPLFDVRDGKRIALFPELMARMDALKRDRVSSGLFFMRDWIDRRAGRPLPWAGNRGDINLVGKKTKAILRGAGLRPELSFTSFRHGGFTELGDAELTDAQIRALSRQKTAKVVGGYVKRTQRQIIEGTHRRRAMRPADKPVARDRQLSLFEE
jgi:hypothetical protein